MAINDPRDTSPISEFYQQNIITTAMATAEIQKLLGRTITELVQNSVREVLQKELAVELTKSEDGYSLHLRIYLKGATRQGILYPETPLCEFDLPTQPDADMSMTEVIDDFS